MGRTKRIQLTFLIGGLLTSVACNLPNYPQTLPATPIEIGPEGTEPIGFRGVILKIPVGTEIGYYHQGLINRKIFPYRWELTVAAGSQEFNVISNEELKTRGFNIVGGEINLFESSNESGHARFQLGGVITGETYNTYSNVGGNSCDASITVEWQLFDGWKKESLFKNTTSGWAKQNGHSMGVVFEAYRNAVRELTANIDFVNLVKKKEKGSNSIERKIDLISINSCQYEKELFLPKDMERALDSVVTIRLGAGHGTGVIISREGYLLTAEHVVSGIQEVEAHFRSGLKLTAKVIVTDKNQDLALLRLPGSGYSCISFSSETPAIGSEVFIIGTPREENLGWSVSKGIVSGIRAIDGGSYLQTDASINPGNSGGPMVDATGHIVGIVSWKYVGYDGLNFVVPTTTVSTALGISYK